MKTILVVLLAALCGCIAQEDTMPGQSKETLYGALVGIREVQNSAGQVVKSGDGKGIFRLTPGPGTEFAFNPTKESYEIRQNIGGSGAVPATRTITVGSPLEINGGGSADLTSNLTITMPNPISDVQHGARSGGLLHAEANGNDAGFLSPTQYAHLAQQMGIQGPITTDTTIDCSDGGFVKVDCSGGNVTITLDVTTFANGRQITIKRVVDPVGGACQIVRSDTGLFEDGSPSIALTASFASITLALEVNLALMNPYSAWKIAKW